MFFLSDVFRRESITFAIFFYRIKTTDDKTRYAKRKMDKVYVVSESAETERYPEERHRYPSQDPVMRAILRYRADQYANSRR